MRLAVSSYSFQQRVKKGEMTQFETIREAARMGFDGIEFTDLRPENDPKPTLEEQLAYAKRLREEAAAEGVEIVGYMVGANLYRGSREADDAEVDRLKGQLDVAAAMGAKLFRHDVCYSEKLGEKVVGFDRMLPTIAENARRITEYAQALGIRTCTENHGRIAQDRDRMERLWLAVDHENYGLLLDVGNFACADEDSVLAVSRLAPLAIHVHAKDFLAYPYGTPVPEGVKSFSTRACNQLVGCAVGDGVIPVKQCLAILKNAGYDGYVTVEFEGPKDCIEEIEKGLSRLKEYLS